MQSSANSTRNTDAPASATLPNPNDGRPERLTSRFGSPSFSVEGKTFLQDSRGLAELRCRAGDLRGGNVQARNRGEVEGISGKGCGGLCETIAVDKVGPIDKFTAKSRPYL